jgi:hypothetical protein
MIIAVSDVGDGVGVGVGGLDVVVVDFGQQVYSP